MFTYAIKRLLASLPILFFVTVIIFALVEFAPGDIADHFINPEINYSPEAIQQIRARYGLDQPAPVRYVRWLENVAQGDLGYSFVSGEPVARMIARRFNNTIILMGTALVLGLITGILLGIFTGLRQYSLWDYSLTTLSFLGISMPAFITGILALYIFSIQLQWFPAGGIRPVGVDASFLVRAHYLALPSLVLTLSLGATFMRYTRFSVLEVMHSDFVRTARSKGLAERFVTYSHIMPNAILPVITVIGLSLPALVVGAVFTETIFSWPGMGTLYLTAVNARDVPLIMGLNLVITVMVLLANLITDIAYGIVDPRIRYD